MEARYIIARCFCGLGLVSTNKSCSMPPISFQDLPLNIYMVIFGTGIFVFMLSLIFCCYFISKLRNQAQSERYGYKEVVIKGDAKKLQLYGQTCAVCLEDFKGKDELGVLPCQHAFHRKCLVKWLEVRCVCPMCNKPIAGPSEATQNIGILLDELWKPSPVQGKPLIQRAMIGDVLDQAAVWDELLLSYHVFKFVQIELGKAQLLCDLDADGHDDLANVNSGHNALGLSKGTSNTSLVSVIAKNIKPLQKPPNGP
ncbi:hypothetical protein P7K49_027417 [Saguinus oedipus]|uniref:RING-type domain-containing protein n=1 Tax=Saguinus oedipus TaxID=9490 RepID=A0ABQ9U9E0_SAGOE|nr:hypothetical protein P7K49_027417 [Saguinus oedipus]